jgi:hypothetical protein
MTTVHIRLVVVRLDCPCGREMEVVCRVSGKAARHQYADTREVETVSMICEAGCTLTDQEYGVLRDEAEALALDDMFEEEKGW